VSIAHQHDKIPRFAIVTAGALVLTVLSAVSIARLTGMPPAASPVADRAAAKVKAISSRELRFFDQPDGALKIVDANTGSTADLLTPGSTSGFIRGVMRGMARERHKFGATAQTPFRLTLWANGQMSLSDPETGRIIELSGFGDTNYAAFKALLT
jgi:putative photosynthetic complex assembly protein